MYDILQENIGNNFKFILRFHKNTSDIDILYCLKKLHTNIIYENASEKGLSYLVTNKEGLILLLLEFSSSAH